MKSFGFLFVFVLLQLSEASLFKKASFIKDTYIINGVDAKIGEFPHQLLLERKAGSGYAFTCGAVLVSRHQAFTAAHCVDASSPQSYRIVAGLNLRDKRTDTQTINIKKIDAHPEYNDQTATFSNDFAILTFEKPIEFTPVVQPIYFNLDDNVTFTGDSCTLSGWGKTHITSNQMVLQKVNMDVISNKECQQKSLSGAKIYPGHICLLKDVYGSCSGDSGGPLTCQYKENRILAGVTSWGVFGGGTCVTKYPSVYARISYFKDFINKHFIK